MTKRNWNAYIDESGDEGFRKLGERANGANDASSEWLILVGVLIREEDDVERTRAVDRLRSALKRPSPKPLHWRDIRNHTARRQAMDILAAEPLFFSAVGLWKPALTGGRAPGLQKKGQLYNYAARYLIERLSWFADNSGRGLNLLFESRATTSYSQLEAYVETIQADPQCTIAEGCIASVRPVAANRKGAQLADLYAGAVSDALEYDAAGYIEPDYLLRVKHQVFRRPGRPVLKDGMKLFPDNAIPYARYEWLKEL